MEEIKIIQYGCGKMSKYTMRYAIENGYKIVGAIDINPDLIGKDIGNVIGCDDVGVKITSVNDAESLFQSAKADVCIVTTMSLLNDVKDSLMLCAKYGVNAITTCEEAFYPMNSNPHLTLEIDKIAKENNCTITGSGYQDAFWGNLISTLAGTTQRITKIKGSSSYNVEDYGIALAKAHGAGLTNEEFQRDVASADNISDDERQALIDKGEFLPSYMWNVNGWLCDKLGLHVKSQSQKCIPTFNDKEIYSKTLDMNITTDRATGMSAVVTTETQEGILLETECIGKVYGENDCDKNDWTVMGEPDTNLVITRPSTVELTCAAIVNRIPDVIASDSGFVPTSKMGELKYTVK
ncbi:MAG: dihydrodipicolinate reductase [Bacilli bacterium]